MNINYDTKEDIINSIKKFVEVNGRAPKRNEMRACDGYVSDNTVRKFYKNFREALDDSGINESDNKTKYTKEDVIDSIKRFIEINGRIPKREELKASEGYVSEKAIRKYFRKFEDALKEADVKIKEKSNKIEYTKEDAINSVKEYYKNTGEVPTSKDMKASKGYVPGYRIYELFGNFKSAIASIDIVVGRKKYTKEDIIKRFYYTNGTIPTARKMKSCDGYISYNEILKVYSSFEDALVDSGFMRSEYTKEDI